MSEITKDTNGLPEDYYSTDWLDHFKSLGMTPYDPTKVINIIPNETTTTTGQGLWSQIDTNLQDPWKIRLIEIEKQMELVKIDLKLSRLKILSLEGKFTQEEIANIRKMIMSEDEASRTLADSIIDNA